MVVEDEFLAKGLVQSGDEKQRVWRVVRVDHIKTVLECNVQAHEQAGRGKVEIFDKIANDRRHLEPSSL